jgi:hypothetical protein
MPEFLHDWWRPEPADTQAPTSEGGRDVSGIRRVSLSVNAQPRDLGEVRLVIAF